MKLVEAFSLPIGGDRRRSRNLEPKHLHHATNVLKGVFHIFLVGSLASSLLLAQFDTATVLGTVRDTTGGAVSGCGVQLQNVQNAVSTTSHTGDAGDFQFLSVSGAASTVEGESSDRGQVIGREPTVDLPLSGRNYADLALLVPGIRKSSLASSEEGSLM
jgi:hypothetical protein